MTKEEYIVQKIHWFGAFLTYMGGNIYMFIQTIISIVLSLGTKKGQWRRRTAFLRLVISILTATLIAAGIGTGISSATHSDEGKQQPRKTLYSYQPFFRLREGFASPKPSLHGKVFASALSS